MDRRDFLKMGGLATTGLILTGCQSKKIEMERPLKTAPGCMADYADKPMDEIRIGFIGYGMRGPGMMSGLMRFENVRITAVCDLYEDRAQRAANDVKKIYGTEPVKYFGPEGYKKLCEQKDVDLVYICTPWLTHTPMALCAMNNGKHAAVEVPAFVTLEDCWNIVETAERTQRHCIMLENCCYGQTELFAVNLIRNGLLGETVHGEGAYIHDLRSLKDLDPALGGYQGRWRMQEAYTRNGNIYCTHGLGPISQMMNVGRGDQFDYLVSMSSNQFGLTEYMERVHGKNSPEAKRTYLLGDMNTTLVRTVNGKSIMIQHDCTSPRPYSRINTISGTDGIFADYPARLAIEKDEKGAHGWMKTEEFNQMYRQYEHPLWKRCGELASKVGGHGGMDFLMNWRLVYCLVNGLPLDINLYESVSWCAIGAVSEVSVANGSAPVKVPDFTRGAWKNIKPWPVVDIDLSKTQIRGFKIEKVVDPGFNH